MTDPTIQKTWEFALNGVALANTTLGATNAHQDRREMLLDIVQALTNAGPHTGTFTVPWTVVQSSNGSTAGLRGQVGAAFPISCGATRILLAPHTLGFFSNRRASARHSNS